MKLDALNLINLILIVTSITMIFAYVRYSYKNAIHKIHISFLYQKLSPALNYSKKLSPLEFLAFEKYEVWRYCFPF